MIETEYKKSGCKPLLFLLGALCSLISLSLIYAQTENESKPLRGERSAQIDLKEIRTSPVRFQNYSNRPAPSAMKALDRQLGEKLLSTSKAKKLFLGGIGIKIKRVFDPGKPGLGADIISIDKNSRIGHINRLQRVLASYLKTNFSFTESGALSTSRFILYYNARKRRDLSAVKKRYSLQVVNALDPKKIGIDRSYRNWVGKTALLLPLRKNIVAGQGTDLNLKEIRKEAGAAPLAEREELRKTERQRNQKEIEKLDQEAKGLAKTQKETQKTVDDVQKEKSALKKKQALGAQKLNKLKQAPQKNAAAIKKLEKEQKQSAQKQKKNANQEKELGQKQQELAQKQKEVSEQQKEASESKKELARALPPSTTQTKAKKQNPTANRTAESQSAAAADREKLKKLEEENKRLKAQKKYEVSKNIIQDKLLFMRIVRYTKKGHYQNELWYLDAAKDDALLRSSFTKICSRDFTVVPNVGVVVTGYKGDVDNKTDHHLVLLDINKLHRIKQSKAYVHWRTPIIHYNNKIYAFIQKKEEYYLARFNTNLDQEVSSKDVINPYANIAFYKNKIYLTGGTKDKKAASIHIFKMKDLSTIKVIQPERLRAQAK